MPGFTGGRRDGRHCPGHRAAEQEPESSPSAAGLTQAVDRDRETIERRAVHRSTPLGMPSAFPKPGGRATRAGHGERLGGSPNRRAD